MRLNKALDSFIYVFLFFIPLFTPGAAVGVVTVHLACVTHSQQSVCVHTLGTH
jgi:hypothetical protein